MSADYLKKPIHDPTGLLKDAKKYLKQLEPYDALVGTGLSGALAIPLIAFKLHKRFCIIRKELDSTHSCEMLEGNIQHGDNCIFVDDLIDTGRTFHRVCDNIKNSGHSKFLGIYLYSRNDIITVDKADISDRSLDFLSPRDIRSIQKKLRSTA